MGNLKIPPEGALAPEKLALECTVMAIRESLMYYFKGSCVEDLTNTNVLLRKEYQTDGGRSYQRHHNNLIDKHLLTIGSTPIMRLSKVPNAIGFYSATLRRSDEMKAIRIAIEAFLKKYLRSVEQRNVRGGSAAATDDSDLILKNLPGSRTRQEDVMEYTMERMREMANTRVNSMQQFYTQYTQLSTDDGTVNIRPQLVRPQFVTRNVTMNESELIPDSLFMPIEDEARGMDDSMPF